MSDIEMVNDIQGWCPECGGTGMVMRGEPDDCPNLVLHRFLDALTRNRVRYISSSGFLRLGGEVSEDSDLLYEVRELADDLRYATSVYLDDHYRGYRQAEDDIKRKLLAILDLEK